MKETKYKKTQKIKAAILAVCILISGTAYSCRRFSETKDISENTYIIKETEDDLEETSTVEISENSILNSADNEIIEFVYAYICGEVANPGVYKLNLGSRVYEAVDMAGGFTKDAAENYINLADIIEDGMKIYIPNKTEYENFSQAHIDNFPNTDVNVNNFKININKATKEQLMTLTGIGEKRAEDIINYREANGAFLSIEDIMNVSGIKDNAFQKIKDNITV